MMIVNSIFAVLLRCLMLIESDNCEKLSVENDEITDFLNLYKMMKQHQSKNERKEVINNIYLIPMPMMMPKMNEESSRPQIEASNRKFDDDDDDDDDRFDAVFRDFEANTAGGKKQNMRKTTESSENFKPEKHKNWGLLPSACGQSLVGDRIIGGESADLGQYPWMVRIGFINRNKNESTPIFRCGASLITDTHAITAAHCVTDLPPELEVALLRLGEYNTDTIVDCVENRCADRVIDVKPKLITIHENYGTPTARNDIALITVENAVKLSEWVTPICLPFGDVMTTDYTFQKGEVAGWGFYDISINRGSSILQTVQLPILRSQPCSKVFRGVLINYKKQYCVGGELGKDSCNGDSGGPLMKVVSTEKEPKYVLLGIVSLGAKYCGLTTAPAIYTKIPYYMEWILDNLV